MAMIDYGSVAKKNGKIIQRDMFMNMKEAVGFEIKSAKYNIDGNVFEETIKGNYFSYIGDKDLLICVYKCGLTIVSNNKVLRFINGLEKDPYLNYKTMVYKFEVNGVKFYLKRLNEQSNRYKLRFEYKNNLYEVLYGYGVDVDKNKWYDVTKKERRYINKWFNKNKLYKQREILI